MAQGVNEIKSERERERESVFEQLLLQAHPLIILKTGLVYVRRRQEWGNKMQLHYKDKQDSRAAH